MKHILKKIWPLLLILIVEVILFSRNYTPNTWLAGWDSLMPEFNPKVNFLRTFFGIWQEHRGLGYADGMSHAAETLHVLFIWFLTTFLPLPLVRYTFVFLTHLVGGIGAYLLIKKCIKNHAQNHLTETLVALLGTFFYLFNTATIQTFAIPFESFIIQFAVLPWLLYGLMMYLQSPTKKTYVFFALICIASSAQYFVPTLFFGSTLLFLSLLFSIVRSLQTNRLKLTAIAIGTYIISNLYWALPYAATLPYTAPVIKNAKFNVMSSENVVLTNQTRGSFLDIMSLRGYTLDTDMPDKNGAFGNFFTPVRLRADSLAGTLDSSLYPILSFIVLFYILSKRKNISYPIFSLAGIFIAAGIYIFLLGSTIPGISQIHEYIRTTFPIIGEAFRDPFTKFRIPFALCLTILGSLGLTLLSSLFQVKKVFFIVAGFTTAGIISLSIPFWQGYFIHPYMRVQIPDSYTKLYEFMRTKPDGRIALFPQTTFWSWRATQYEYTGSGFIWYGFSQPTMDRSFDPWSRENENYYWEISYAMYKKDIELFTQVLKKYNITYILIDRSSRALFGQPTALFYDELSEMLTKIPGVSLEKTFDTLSMYSVPHLNNKNIELAIQIPTIGPSFRYGDHDVAYNQFGNYNSSLQDYDIYFPFRPLSSKRGETYSGVSISEAQSFISVSADIHALPLSEYISSSSSTSAQIDTTKKTVTANIDKTTSLRYSATAGKEFTESLAVPCSVNRYGSAQVSLMHERSTSWIRLKAKLDNACFQIGADTLEHTKGYIIAIESRNIQGKPILVSVANSTARHTEIDEHLSRDTNWHMDYFIVPTMAADGLGYSLYFTNEGKGLGESINDIKSVRFYEFPYDELANFYFQKVNFIKNPTISRENNGTLIQTSHPNPAYYDINLFNITDTPTTLILSQSFHPDWKAYDMSEMCKVKNAKCYVAKLLPFIFGTKIKDHMLINNWANGWEMKPSDFSNQLSAENCKKTNRLTTDPLRRNLSEASDCRLTTIILFFWPQLLEWGGFLLLPIPFLFGYQLQKNSKPLTMNA